MINKEYVEKFKNVMKEGKWHERYLVVREKYFIVNNLVEDPICKSILIEAALKEKAKLVKSEAVRTCNLLKITYKGQQIRLRKMPSIDIVTKMNAESRRELVFLVTMNTDVPMFPRNRKLTDNEKKKISIKLEEMHPKLYDIMDGYYTNNKPGVINKKKNKKLQACLESYLNSVSTKRIMKYYKKHPERIKCELPEYRDEIYKKIESMDKTKIQKQSIESV